jgi:hypothetical protein
MNTIWRIISYIGNWKNYLCTWGALNLQEMYQVDCNSFKTEEWKRIEMNKKSDLVHLKTDIFVFVILVRKVFIHL